MYEDGPGKVMSGVEIAPSAPEDTNQVKRTQFVNSSRCENKHGKLVTRMLLATADCRNGYGSIAAQVVLAYAGTRSGVGDYRGAVIARQISGRW